MSQHISAPTFPLGNASLSYKIGSGWDGQQSRKDRWSGSKSCTMEFCTLKLFTVLFSFYSVLALPQWLPPTGNRAACLLQVDDGPCRAAIERYYYNTFTQKCEIFYYGGCKGNANNFNSYQECQKSCFRFPKIPQICRYPRDEGPCRALFLNYFFNMTTMQCEPFYYGGCQGNPNRFQDHTSCVEYCSPRKTLSVLCLDPLDKGKCSASITRYYYNKDKKMCEEFTYTGCGGSSNNFVSRQDCMDVCVKGGRQRIGQGKVYRMRRNRNNSNTFLQV